MATVRQEIIEAFRRLEDRTGRSAFTVGEISGEVGAFTLAFAEATIGTYVRSVMCADAPVHHTNHTDDLRRVGRGLYALVESAGAEGFVDSVLEEGRSAPPPTSVGVQPWFWEGNVQSAAIAGLSGEGWQIRSVADTESRAQGTDIVASLGGQALHVEVKGYPTDTYARGDNAGQAKPTHPATQARVWFSGALMKAAMLRNDHPDDAVAMALPSFPTYTTLADRVSRTLDAASIGLIWVDETSEVTLRLV